MTQSRMIHYMKVEYARWVNYVRGLISSAADMEAEDFVQDVLVRILERSNISVPLENFAAYVYASLRHRVANYFRQRRLQESLDKPGLADSGLRIRDLLQDQHVDTLTVLEDKEWRLALFKAIKRLSSIEQEVLIATEFEGRKYRDLAEEWDMPLNTLLSHKTRAIKKLGQYLIAWKTI